MKTFKTLLIFFIALTLISGITGVQSAHISIKSTSASTSTYSEVGEHNVYGRLLSFVEAGIFAIFYYGISKKLLIAWKLGWLFLVGIPIGVTIGAFCSFVGLPYPQNLFFSCLCLIGFGGFTLYWGLWWKRQRSYFNPTS